MNTKFRSANNWKLTFQWMDSIAVGLDTWNVNFMVNKPKSISMNIEIYIYMPNSFSLINAISICTQSNELCLHVKWIIFSSFTGIQNNNHKWMLQWTTKPIWNNCSTCRVAISSNWESGLSSAINKNDARHPIQWRIYWFCQINVNCL